MESSVNFCKKKHFKFKFVEWRMNILCYLVDTGFMVSYYYDYFVILCS